MSPAFFERRSTGTYEIIGPNKLRLNHELLISSFGQTVNASGCSGDGDSDNDLYTMTQDIYFDILFWESLDVQGPPKAVRVDFESESTYCDDGAVVGPDESVWEEVYNRVFYRLGGNHN
jgi:hypothetical protein